MLIMGAFMSKLFNIFILDIDDVQEPPQTLDKPLIKADPTPEYKSLRYESIDDYIKRTNYDIR
jgi:hypothetical protein